MSSRELVEDFLIRNAWHLVRPLDLGTTSHIFVIEKDNARQVLKIRMDGDARILKAEYRMLQYLNTTKMQQDVPKVGGGLPELEGFLMEELRYPFQSERNSQAWMLNLVQALRTRTQCLC